MKDLPAILGGDKVREKPFPRRITMGDEEKKAVQKVMDSDVLSAFFGSPGELFLGGPKIKEFENNWASSDFGFKYAISVNSWTSGSDDSA
jgi:perosamine synthetase